MNELERAYLAHHGILGQKWGRRNGPPYPLGESDHSVEEKKTLRKSLSGKRHEEMYDRKQKSSSQASQSKKDFHLTDKQKKYIKMGATVATTALVAYAGYKVATDPKLRALAGKGIDAVTKRPSVDDLLKNSGPVIVSKKTGQVVNDIGFGGTKPLSAENIKTVYKGINPAKNAPLSDVNFILKTRDNKPLSDVNCQACTLAYELKRRTGKDYCANLIDTRQFANPVSLFNKIYKKGGNSLKQASVKKWSDLDDYFYKTMGSSARGNLMIQHSISGQKHSLAFEVLKNGKLQIYDTQIERAFTTSSGVLDKVYGASKDKILFLRTDNLELNDLEFVERLVHSTV